MSDQRTTITRQEAHAPYFVGIDIGGTNVKAGVVDDTGRILTFKQIATQVSRGGEDAAERIGMMFREMLEDVGLMPGEISGLGVGCPGPMDIPAGKLLIPMNLKGWENFPVRDRVAHHCHFPVTFNNDANAAAYGEFWVGGGREFSSMILLTLGTGVGGGIIIDHLSIDGEHSHGGELGHILIDYHPDARQCARGYRGHLEAYASATSVVKRTQEALDAGRTSSLTGRMEAGEKLTSLMLSQEAEAGDELSLEIIRETAMFLAVGITTLCHTVDPAAVIIGGAMTFGREASPVGRMFLNELRQEVGRLAFPQVSQNVKILYGSLGNDAGFIGAAGLARVAYRQQPTRLGSMG